MYKSDFTFSRALKLPNARLYMWNYTLAPCGLYEAGPDRALLWGNAGALRWGPLRGGFSSALTGFHNHVCVCVWDRDEAVSALRLRGSSSSCSM